ncbi:MAG TPA: LCP family protein, partial [Actinophytocola sp.]|nr:LCP family protein [Actinophytocola sp.]
MSDGRRRGGARRAPKSHRIPRANRSSAEPARSGQPAKDGARARGGARALRPRGRRTHGLPGTVGMTFLGALVPGSGYLYAGRRAVGAVVLLVWLILLGGLAYYFGRDVRPALDLAFDPTRLKLLAGALVAGLVVWAFVVFTSHRLVRPQERPRWHTVTGNVLVAVLCLVMTYPVVTAARNALAQAELVSTVFDDNESATTPQGRTKENPWAGTDRVNVLLLGGDGGEGRTGVRTDTVILISMNTNTGKTVMFSLPRNMMNAQFPEDSPLHDLYPYGYTGSSDPGFYMLNAIYGQVPVNHPGVLGKSDNEGADAIKQAVAGSLGTHVDYYLLINLLGFQQLVDAIGGVTVNINEPVAINGNTDLGIPPTDYLDPGPDQHLDGFDALWFARGRWGSDDYERMERQRCMVDAIIDAARPMNLFSHYTDLAEAGKEVVYTDIPLKLAPAFVGLALKVKDAKIKSVVFRNSDKFFSGDPDFDYMRDVVQKTLNPPPRPPGAPKPPQTEAVEPVDACAYNP